jgi:hypothetical protein
MHGQTEPEASAWAERLRVANINPRTGLATDYLNHFNEAVMLLEMVPDMPECAEDFLTWSPLSYAEHFTASNFKARDLAIEAYEKADPNVRAQFDHLADTMDPDGGRLGHARGREGHHPRPPRRAGRPLGQAADRGLRRHHQWRRGSRRRHHHGELSPSR